MLGDLFRLLGKLLAGIVALLPASSEGLAGCSGECSSYVEVLENKEAATAAGLRACAEQWRSPHRRS